MTKQLIVGIAVIAITGTALLTTGMYAASGNTNPMKSANWIQKEQINHEYMIQTLSWKVSNEALTALDTLMKKHKTEMGTLNSSGSALDKTAMEAKHAAFKAEMDTLMIQYPELKTAIPQKNMQKSGKGGNHKEVETIFSSLPENIQTEIKSIRESYKEKQDLLRSEEKLKINTILSSYPDIKNKLDTIEKNREGHPGKMR